MIKEVKEIPKPESHKKVSPAVSQYREDIYRDIKDAFLKRISRFELLGYDASPSYIGGLAKEEAFKICNDLVFNPARTYVRGVLKTEFDEDSIRIPCKTQYENNPVIKVFGVTLAGGVKHIYCEIDFEAAEYYKNDLIELSRQRTLEHIKKENQLRKQKAEREKWLLR